MPPRAAGRGGAGRGRSVSPTKGKSLGRGRRGACQNPEEEVGLNGNTLHILVDVMHV